MTTPSEWIEKALSAADSQEKKQKTPLWQWAVTAAACFVVISCVSFILLTGLNTKQPVEIKIVVNQDSTVSTEEKTQQPSSETIETEAINPSRQSETNQDSFYVSPSELPAQVSPTNMNTVSTEQIMETKGTPTEQQTDVATENTTQAATEFNTEPACETFEPHSQPATEQSIEYVDTIIKTFYIPPDDIVYCKITDFSGNTVYGDEEPYSEQHLCQVIERTKLNVTVSYSPKELGILPQSGAYRCVFYDSWGAVLLNETVYLNN